MKFPEIRNPFKAVIKKYRQHKYGERCFTFPDGAILYRLKEDYFEELPNDKLLDIQENNNFIAYLGVAKDTLFAAIDKSKSLGAEAKILLESDIKNNVKLAIKKLESQQAVYDTISSNVVDYADTQEHILVSLFDMFYFFNDEDISVRKEETLERKRDYLRKYPYFRDFFLQSLQTYTSLYKSTLQNCIRFAIIQTALAEEVLRAVNADLKSTNTSVPKTN